MYISVPFVYSISIMCTVDILYFCLHTINQDYECPYCPYSAKRRLVFRRHLTSKHGKELRPRKTDSGKLVEQIVELSGQDLVDRLAAVKRASHSDRRRRGRATVRLSGPFLATAECTVEIPTSDPPLPSTITSVNGFSTPHDDWECMVDTTWNHLPELASVSSVMDQSSNGDRCPDMFDFGPDLSAGQDWTWIDALLDPSHVIGSSIMSSQSPSSAEGFSPALQTSQPSDVVGASTNLPSLSEAVAEPLNPSPSLSNVFDHSLTWQQLQLSDVAVMTAPSSQQSTCAFGKSSLLQPSGEARSSSYISPHKDDMSTVSSSVAVESSSTTSEKSTVDVDFCVAQSEIGHYTASDGLQGLYSVFDLDDIIFNDYLLKYD